MFLILCPYSVWIPSYSCNCTFDLKTVSFVGEIHGLYVKSVFCTGVVQEQHSGMLSKCIIA